MRPLLAIKLYVYRRDTESTGKRTERSRAPQSVFELLGAALLGAEWSQAQVEAPHWAKHIGVVPGEGH